MAWGDDERMDAAEAGEAMAQLRLQAALVEHIEGTEPVPPEVSQAVRDMFREQST